MDLFQLKKYLAFILHYNLTVLLAKDEVGQWGLAQLVRNGLESHKDLSSIPAADMRTLLVGSSMYPL